MPPVHKNHNVYILGAGFSYEAGLPLINEFLERMGDSSDWLRANQRDDEANAIDRVFDFRLKAAGAGYRSNIDIENIEELFSLAAASEGESHTDYVTTAIAATLDYCRRTAGAKEAFVLQDRANNPIVRQNWQELAQDEGAQLGGFTHALPAYDLYVGHLSGAMCDESPNMRNTIITFNYDTLVEDSLSNLGVTFHYGLGGNAARLENDARCVLSDQAPPDSIAILKLNGSVNWAAGIRNDDPISLYGAYDNLRANNRHVLLLPPTWRKAFGGHLVGVWENALRALSEATRVVIIGFSMPATDTHFKYLLASGLRDNISLRKVVFVNPGLVHDDLKEVLMANLFKVLRPELEVRGILVPKDCGTYQYLLQRENETLNNRRVTSKFLRLSISTRDGHRIGIRG